MVLRSTIQVVGQVQGWLGIGGERTGQPGGVSLGSLNRADTIAPPTGFAAG